MAKKIFCLVVVATMLCSVFAVSTSASIAASKTYFEENFTRPADQIDNEDWKPEDWTIGLKNGQTFRVHPDGYAELNANGTGEAATLTSKALTLPSDFTLMFDVKYSKVNETEDTTNMRIECALNGFNQQLLLDGGVLYIPEESAETDREDAGAHEADKWYTYIYQVKGDRMSVYRKAEGEDVFVRKLDNAKMSTRGGNNFYAYSKSECLCLDNIKVFAGTYMTDSNISFNDEKTLITGTMSVICADAAPFAKVVVSEQQEELVESPRSVLSVMTVYDARGKIIAFKSEEKELKFNNENTVVTTIDFTTPTLKDVKYDDLIGGTVELYLWDLPLSGLTPLTKACVMTIE